MLTGAIRAYGADSDRRFYTGMAIAIVVIVSQPLRLIVSQTPPWLAFGDWVKG